MAEKPTLTEAPETLQNVDTVDGVSSNQPVTPAPIVEEEQVIPEILDTQDTVTPEENLPLPEEEAPLPEEEFKHTITKPDEVLVGNHVIKDTTQDLAKIKANPNLSTMAEAVEKHTIANRPKAALISEAANNPIAMMALMAEGAITSKEVAAHRNQVSLQTAQAKVQNLEKAWIKAPESNVFAGTGNTVLQFLTGTADLVLAIPDAAVTHYGVLSNEPRGETDLAMQTFMLGTTKLHELDRTRSNETLDAGTREDAQREYDELDNVLTEMQGQLKAQPDYDDAHDRYAADYFEDQSVNYISKVRDSISVGNNEALDSLTNSITDVVGNNLDTLAVAKSALDQGNLMEATGAFFSGIAGLGAQSVSAIVQNPRAVIDLTAYSMGNLVAGGLITKGATSLLGAARVGVSIPDKFGALLGYQSMFAADAYQSFEQEYGHLPEAQQALILNGVSGMAAFLAVSGDDFMVNNLSKLTKSAHSIKNSAFKDVLSGVPASQARVTAQRIAGAAVPKRTLKGAATETVQEFSESLLTQYAGIQDWEQVSSEDALVEGLLAAGAGGLTGAVGDVGSALRGARKGNFTNILGKAKEGYSPIRNEIKDAETFASVNESIATDLNATASTVERAADGTILPTQANITKVAALYDSMLSLVGGLDSVLGNTPLMKDVNINDMLTKSIQSGVSVNDALLSTMGILKDALNPDKLGEAYAANPESLKPLMDAVKAMPEHADTLGNNFGDYVTALSQVTGQVNNYVNALTTNFDLDALAASIDTQTSDARKAMAKDKVSRKKAADQQEIIDEVTPVRERSKFSTEEVIYQFREDLKESTDDIETEAETTSTETANATEVTEAEAVTIAEENTSTEKEGGVVLESPTTAVPSYVASFQNNQNKAGIPLDTHANSKFANLGDVNASMRGMLTKINSGADTDGKIAGAYIGMVRALGNQLSKLAAKTSLSDTEKVTANAITDAIATYAYGFSKSSKTNNADLQKLYTNSQGIKNVNLAATQKKLKALGVSSPAGAVNLFAILSGFGGKMSGKSKSKAQTTTGGISRPSAAVADTQRKGTISTESLKDLNLNDAFTMLGGLVHGVFEGKVADASEAMVADVSDTLASGTEFDTLYTALKTSVEGLQKSSKQIFKTSKHEAVQKEKVAKAYLDLAEYFKRVDSDNRDLTYVLAMHSPEIHKAMNKVLDSAPIPSEFSEKMNKQAQELIYVELPTTEEELPKTSAEKHGVVIDGLNAIQHAGKETVAKFLTYLVEKEELSPTGDTVSSLTAILKSDNILDYALPIKLVNTASMKRINSFVNENSLPNRVKDAEVATEATWARNQYNGVQEAFARLGLATPKTDIFKVNGTQHGGMYQVFNLFTVLESPEHENHKKVVESFTSDELAQLQRVLPLIQEMRNTYAHLYHKNEGLVEFMHNNRALDLFESMSSTGSSANSDNYIHPALSAIVAQTALEYAMSDGITALGYNDADAIADILGGNKSLAQNAVVRDALSSGSMVNSVATNLGREIIKRLGVAIDGKVANNEDLGQLEVSLGHMAIYGLVNSGIIEGYTFGMTKDAAGNQGVFIQNDLKKPEVKGATLDTSTTRRMLRFNEAKLQEIEGKSEFETAFEELSLDKEVVVKLYGEASKNDIATTAEDIVISKGNDTINSLVRTVAAKTPLYLHNAKLAMFENLSLDTKLGILKGNLSTEGKHETRHKAIEGKNRKAKATLARIHNTAKALGETGKYYLHQIVGSNMRYTGNNPKGIDPVNMSEARFLTNVAAEDIITFNSGNAQSDAVALMFQKAVLQNLDNKAEELSDAETDGVFQKLLADEHVQKAIALVSKAKTEALSSDESMELLSLLDGSYPDVSFETESAAHGLDAIHALSQYQDAYVEGEIFSFDGHIGIETDGKNNGSAIGWLQNAPLVNIEDALRMAKSVGLNFDDEQNSSFASMKGATKGFLDAYQHLARAAGEAGDRLTSSQYTPEEIVELLADVFAEMPNRAEVYNTLLTLLAPQSSKAKVASILEPDADGEMKVSSMGRQLFKDVLMTVLYGASVETQDGYFANRIADTFIDSLEYLAGAEDTEALRAQTRDYINQVNSLGMQQRIPLPNFNGNWQAELLTEAYGLKASSIVELTDMVANSIGLTYRDALNTPTYKTIIEQAGSIAESANVKHIQSVLVLRKLRARYIQSLGLEADAILTGNQEREFMDTVAMPVLAVTAAPIGSTSVSEDSVNGVAITKRTRGREDIPASVLAAAEAAYEAELKKNPSFKGISQQFLPEKYKRQWVQDFAAQGALSTLRSQVLKVLMESPALSTAPSIVHSTDSAVQLLAGLMQDTPFVNIFDAQLGLASTMVGLGNTANTSFSEVMSSYNIYEALAEAYSISDAKMKEQLSEQEMAEINTEVASALGLPDFNYETYMEDVNKAYTAIAKRSRRAQEALISTDQFPMNEATVAHNKGRTEDLTLEMVQEEFADSLADNALPTAVEGKSVRESRDHAKNVSASMTTETEVIVDVTNSDKSRYSVSHSAIGNRFTDIMDNFATNLENISAYMAGEGKANLKQAAKEVRQFMFDNRSKGIYTLPTINPDTLLSDIEQMLQESDISEKTKNTLAHDNGKLLLRTTDMLLTEDVNYTANNVVNIWMNMGNNKKWATAPLSKLLSSDFVDAITLDSPLGMNLAPVEILHSLLTSPKSRAYIGNDANGTNNQFFSKMILDTLSAMSPELRNKMYERSGLLRDTGNWKHLTRVPMFNNMLMDTLLKMSNDPELNFSLKLPLKGKLFSDVDNGKSVLDHLQTRIVRWYDKRGIFTQGTATKANAKKWVRSVLLTTQEQVELGLIQPVTSTEPVVDTAPKNIVEPKRVEMEVMYIPVKGKVQYQVNISGAEATFSGEGLKFHQQGNEVYVTGKDAATVNLDHGLEVTEVDNGLRVTPKLGTPTYDSTDSDTAYHEVSKESLLSTYDTIVNTSTVKDGKQHANRLRSLVSAMSLGLDNVKVMLGETASSVSSGYFMNNTVTVTINKLLPRSVTNFMSAGEVMAHELVHAVTDNLNEISPALAAKAHTLYAQAKASITWQDLIDPNLHPEDAEDVAKRLHDYMFEGNITEEIYTSETTGLSTKRQVSGRVAEFMSLMATNENVSRAGNKVMAQNAEYKGLTAKLIEILNVVFNLLFKRVATDLNKGKTISEEMLNIVYTAAKLQNNHRSLAARTGDTISSGVEKMLDSTDEVVRDFTRATAKWAISQPILGNPSWSNPKSYVAAVLAAPMLFMGYDAFREKLSAQLKRKSLFQKRAVLDIVNEIGSSDTTLHRIYDLISRRVKAIDQARSATESRVADYVKHQMFRTAMSDKVSVALTESVLSTDLVSLVDAVGMDKALDVLAIDNKRLNSLRKAYQAKLKQFDNSAYYINHAKALGESMARGNTVFYGVHNNAHSIARLAGDTDYGNVEVDFVNEIESHVEVLATLYAVMNTPMASRQLARNFLIKDNNFRKENNLDTAESKHVGMSALLDMHRDSKQEALELNFGSNPMLMRKGYIREQYNPNIELMLAFEEDVASYQKQGFEPVTKITDGLTVGQDTRVLMANRYSAKSSYDQGAFSHTGFRAMGTGLVGNDTDSSQDIVLTTSGAKSMDDARASMFTDAPIQRDSVDGAAISPVRNDDGEITGYRYTMSTDIKRKALEREDRLPSVMARTLSSIEDKASSQEHNMVVLNEIYDIFDAEFESSPESFMLVAPVAEGQPKTETSEMWALLPTYTREAIVAKNIERGNGAVAGIYVPTRLATLLFGAAPITVKKMNESNNVIAQYAGATMSKFMENKYGRMFTSLYKEALNTSKDTMVIKNLTTTLGNFVSNVYALSIAGIPQKHIVKKHIQGYKEILQYQTLMHNIGKLQQELAYTKMSDSRASVLRSQLADLEGRVSSLSILPLIDEGLYQTIVEDIDTSADDTPFSTSLEQMSDSLLAKTGVAEKALREGVFITHDSRTYRYLRDAAQISDFVSRYAMFSYMTEEQGKSVKEAVHEARDAFIMYDAPMGKHLKALNDMGFFNFAKFLLRTQRVLGKNIRENPSRVLMYSILWAGMGASATMDVLMTPFNFGEMLMSRARINPIGFIANGLTELPIIKLLT